MTKAEQKKLETKARHEFIDAAAGVILTSIGKHLSDRTEKCSIRMNMNGKNRYFNFERFGQHLRIAVYTTGDIDFRFTESCHSTVDIRVVHYENVPENPKAALKQLKTDADLVIDSFLNYYWHGFMDYVCHIGDESWQDTVRVFQKECRYV